MADIEKVIKGLETIRFNLRQMNHGFLADFCDDAISLLKEEEAVVRCKDCKNLGYTNSHWFCKWLNRCVDEDWFCADGERQEGG